jgi:hypothetical protein
VAVGQSLAGEVKGRVARRIPRVKERGCGGRVGGVHEPKVRVPRALASRLSPQGDTDLRRPLRRDTVYTNGVTDPDIRPRDFVHAAHQGNFGKGHAAWALPAGWASLPPADRDRAAWRMAGAAVQHQHARAVTRLDDRFQAVSVVVGE